MKRKQWIACLGVFLLFGYAVAKKSEDPMMIAVEKLSAQANLVLITGSPCKTCTRDGKGAQVKKGAVTLEYYGEDHTVDLSGKPYQDLLAQFLVTKAILEKGFEDRQDAAIGSGKLKYAAMAASLYFETEKRLYLNYLRNLHQTQSAKPSDLIKLHALNLKMGSSTALTLYFDDKHFGARFNLWHVKDAAGNYDAVEYGLSPQDLSILEEQVLQQTPNDVHYGQLLQFMVARERMTNQWALNRLNGSSYDATSYANCGIKSDLVSFKGLGHGDYYQNLWSSDRADELLALNPVLAPLTEQDHLISEDQLRSVLMGYFNHWGDYQKTILPLTRPADLENYKKNAPKKAIAELEEKWSKDSKHALMDSSFPADAWDNNSVADRVAWEAYHYQEKHLIDLLVNEATLQGIQDVTQHQQLAWSYAEQTIQNSLKGNREKYLSAIRSKVSAALMSASSHAEVAKHRTSRFEETINKVKPGMELTAQADYVVRNVAQKGNKDYENAYLPAKGGLRDRVKLYTPDQLSQFFQKKLAYWVSVGGIFETAGVGPNDVSGVAKAIKKNELVLRGVQDFMASLTSRYFETLKNQGPTKEGIGPNHTPLYSILPEVASQSYQKFASSLKKIDGNTRYKTLKLYGEAMAIMNLGEVSSGKSLPVVHPPGAGDKSIYRIHSLLDMEHVLLEKAQDRDLADRLVRSVLDQRMAAEIIKKQMLDQYPLLAIRDSNDMKATRLGDKMIRFYSPAGLNFDGTKKVALQAIQVASLNSKGLVDEVCNSDPRSPVDGSFKRIFDASQNTRAEITAMDPRFQKYDDAYRKKFRSNWEVFKDDWMDPLATVAVVVTTIALLWYLTPLLYAGVSSMIALESFSLTAFTAGAGGSVGSASVGFSLKSILGFLMTGKVTMLVNGIFLVQALVWGHVHCIELPEHLKYQLQVAQSQIGVYAKAQISESEIERFNQEIHTKKNSTYMMLGFQVVMIPGVWKAGEEVFGFAARGALKRLALVSGPESDAFVNEMTQMSLKDLTRQEGYINGTRQYVAQKLSALKTFGKMNVLGSTASNESLRILLTDNAVELLAEEPQALSQLYESRILDINVEGARIVKLAEKTTLLGKERGGAWWSTVPMKEWIKNKATQIGFKNSKYWKMIVADDALDAMLTGKLLPGPNSGSEVRAMVLYGYARDLMNERDYLIQAKYKLDLYLESGALEGSEALKQHMRVFGDADWARHEELFNWASKHVDKPLLARLNLRWSSQTRVLGNMKRAFKDYRILRGELDHVRDRFWSSEADQSFASETVEPNDIEVDSNGFEIIHPLELGPAEETTYTEILFDPSGLVTP